MLISLRRLIISINALIQDNKITNVLYQNIDTLDKDLNAPKKDINTTVLKMEGQTDGGRDAETVTLEGAETSRQSNELSVTQNSETSNRLSIGKSSSVNPNDSVSQRNSPRIGVGKDRYSGQFVAKKPENLSDKAFAKFIDDTTSVCTSLSDESKKRLADIVVQRFNGTLTSAEAEIMQNDVINASKLNNANSRNPKALKGLPGNSTSGSGLSDLFDIEDYDSKGVYTPKGKGKGK